jgi:hypothetical protein
MPPRRRRYRRFLLVVAAAGLVGTATGVVHAAFFSTTSNSGSAFDAGSVTLTDNDSGGAALTLSSAQPGATDTGCIRLAYTGSLSSTVRHYADVSGALAPYLTLKVTRGTDSSPSFRSCANFTADSNDYYGRGAGVLYEGLLSSYPTTYAAGIVDPSSGAVSNYAATITGTSGIVSYWRLDPKFSSDSFTDTAATTLQSHTGELAATWTKHASSDADAVITNENRIRKNGTNTQMAVYYTSGVPQSADYAVEADFTVKSLVANEREGLVGRLDTAVGTGTYYYARYSVPNTRWELYRVNAGTLTSLANSTNQVLTVGNTYHMRLDMQGTAIKVFVDGVQRISVTSGSIAGAGRAGVRLGTATNTTMTDTTGIHVDNFAVYDLTQTDAVGTNDGTANNQPGVAAGAIPGDADGSLVFDGTDDYVRVARQISDDFSIELWLNSTQGIGTGAAWTTGAGLVDANTAGTTNDFGISLTSEGRVLAGTGNPDTTIQSGTGYNDGAWHHVVFTRVRSSGALTLYVDGQQAATGTGGTNALTASANIDVGRLQTAANYFAGRIDEVAIYNTALPGPTVTAHYDTVRVPEVWTNPEYHSYKLEITLANTNAVEGLSATSTFKWEARNQ